MDKLLRVQMPDRKATFTEIPAAYAGLGGRGLTSAVIAEEVHPLCHPLAEENKLIVTVGLLSGTAASCSGRISVGAKSPLTGGIKEASAGGVVAQKLANLGIAGIIFEGLPPKDQLYVLRLNNKGAEVVAANELKGLGNNDAVSTLTRKYGNKVGYISIGQAGEWKLAASSVAATDMDNIPCRHAGRGGIGAVMGSKGIKAIVIDDAGSPPIAIEHAEDFYKFNKIWAQAILEDIGTGKGMPAYGSASGVAIMDSEGAFPTKNFRYGHFEGINKISGKMMRSIIKERGGRQTLPCSPGCIVQCHRVYNDRNGKYLGKGPEYETIWALGGNLIIDDLDVIVQLGELCDDYGVDTIDTGVALAMAMEAGIIQFGDGKGAIDLVKEIGRGSYLGKVLGSGAAVAAKVFGVNRVPVIKGQAMPAYDPRGFKGMGVTLATSPMAADHTSAYMSATNIGWIRNWKYVPKSQIEGQAAAARDLMIFQTAMDCIGLCQFTYAPLLNSPPAIPAVLGMLNAKFDWKWGWEDFIYLGKKILKAEMEFNSKAGFCPAMNRLPLFFYKEALPPLNQVFDIPDSDLDKVYNF